MEIGKSVPLLLLISQQRSGCYFLPAYHCPQGLASWSSWMKPPCSPAQASRWPGCHLFSPLASHSVLGQLLAGLRPIQTTNFCTWKAKVEVRAPSYWCSWPDPDLRLVSPFLFLLPESLTRWTYLSLSYWSHFCLWLFSPPPLLSVILLFLLFGTLIVSLFISRNKNKG